VVHVLDASRAVAVAGQLKGEGLAEYDAANRVEQERLRKEHGEKKGTKPLLSLVEARKRKPTIDWASYAIPRPAFRGTRSLEVPLAEIVPFIDWSPFFHTWELKGTYPRIFENADWGDRARELFDDAQAELEGLVADGRLRARAAYGFFAANSVGDDVEVYTDERCQGLLTTFHFLRQQADKGPGEANLCLADYVAPREGDAVDWLGAFAVTAGVGIEPIVAELENDHDDYRAIMVKALADRLAEALAEKLHRQVREDWGYGRGEALTTEELIREKYRGIRPAPGYPACPDHTEKRPLFDLIDAEKAAGVSLTESFAMLPAAAVSGFYFAHPDARYFQVGRIGRDQAVDYHRRKGMDLRTVERWLAPNLDYEPDDPRQVEGAEPERGATPEAKRALAIP
jgi:5-methyltetrahydrofolate--homocysteine methyltransferase